MKIDQYKGQNDAIEIALVGYVKDSVHAPKLPIQELPCARPTKPIPRAI